MSSPSCQTFDPVELLLRSVLKRALLLAGAGSLTACVAASEHDDVDNSSLVDEGSRAGEPPDATSRALDAGDDAPTVAAADGLGPALACAGDSNQPVRVDGLKPAQRYDYLSLRRRSSGFETPLNSRNPSWVSAPFELLSETGTKCASAAQDSECTTKVEQHPEDFVPTSCLQTCYEDSIVSTRGDEVERWAGESELALLFGTIDSEDEALLLVAAAGYRLTCDDASATSVRKGGDGYEVYATRLTTTCFPVTTTRYSLHVSKSGEVSEHGSVVLRENPQLCIGRTPVGLVSKGCDAGVSKLGDYLARCAHLEAASIVSFERLARELAVLEAPPKLIEAALEARSDEVRHARIVGRLARERGGLPAAADVTSMPPRTLEEIALENAVEGCVRETFGALVGGYQAEHAEDAELRAAMIAIADDEARHAALAHHVQRWIVTKLAPEARARIQHAQQRAVFVLAGELAIANDPEIERAAGLPSPEMARLLLDELSKVLWHPSRRALQRVG